MPLHGKNEARNDWLVNEHIATVEECLVLIATRAAWAAAKAENIRLRGE